MASRVTLTMKNYQQGLNCAQSVLTAYCEEYGLDKDTAANLSCGFGSGMSGLGEVCGAVSSAYLVLGLKYGSDTRRTYKAIREFERRFSARNGTTNCDELLRISKKDGSATSRKQICNKAVKDAAEILEELLHD